MFPRICISFHTSVTKKVLHMILLLYVFFIIYFIVFDNVWQFVFNILYIYFTLFWFIKRVLFSGKVISWCHLFQCV